MEQEKKERITFLTEMFSCVGNLYLWSYKYDGTLIETNCEYSIIKAIFDNRAVIQEVLPYSADEKMPLIVALEGLVVGCVFHEEQIYIVGPILDFYQAREKIGERLYSQDLGLKQKYELEAILKQLPAISNINFFPFVLMLHQCVTGEKLEQSDIQFLNKGEISQDLEMVGKSERRHTWMAEQALCNAVKMGDIEGYKTALSNAMKVSTGVQIKIKDPLWHAQFSAHAFIVKVVKAAIEGGLSAEIAYSKGDAYLQTIIESTTLTEIAGINHVMYEDFVLSVHENSKNPNISKQMQMCCDYILVHAEEKILLEDLASYIGYTVAHLSRKFKKELGISVSQYITTIKIEKAKRLLITTDLKIEEISEKLNYSSRAYFSELFLKETGLTPAQYRKNNV